MFTNYLTLHQSAWQRSTFMINTGNRAVDGRNTGMSVDVEQCAVSRDRQKVECIVDLGDIRRV